MADASGYTQEQPLPVPKPRPRRPRTGLATGVGAESEKQPSGAVLRRERGASESGRFAVDSTVIIVRVLLDAVVCFFSSLFWMLLVYMVYM